MEVDKATVIDAEAQVEGKLKGKDARILGRFRGEVELSGRLLIGEGSQVDAKILADAVEIAGEYKGEMVSRSITLLEKARVTGTLDAQLLTVREGAQLNGAVSAGAGKGRPATAPAKPATTGAVAG